MFVDDDIDFTASKRYHYGNHGTLTLALVDVTV
jgi:hypothetical protein